MSERETRECSTSSSWLLVAHSDTEKIRNILFPFFTRTLKLSILSRVCSLSLCPNVDISPISTYYYYYYYLLAVLLSSLYPFCLGGRPAGFAPGSSADSADSANAVHQATSPADFAPGKPARAERRADAPSLRRRAAWRDSRGFSGASDSTTG